MGFTTGTTLFLNLQKNSECKCKWEDITVNALAFVNETANKFVTKRTCIVLEELKLAKKKNGIDNERTKKTYS